MKKDFLTISAVLLIAIVVISFLTYFYQSIDTPLAANYNGHEKVVASDQEFLVMMVPHHQEAVDAAKEVIARGGDVPEVKKLAENIILSQEKEIEQMNDWYQAWFGTTPHQTDAYVAMMRPLVSLSGKALDLQFVEDMIGHHEGAVSTARQLQGFTNRPEMRAFATQVITAQSAEIVNMKRWLVDIFKKSNSASSYRDQESRDIKSLSQEDIEGLLAGAGTPLGGMAKPAELNGYPGPRHVLDAVEAGEFEVNAAQKEKIGALYKEMKAQAITLGKQIIVLEQSIDDAFSAGTMTEAYLQETITKNAELYGQLRMVHLKYHLAMKDVLSTEQVLHYNKLRGYAETGDPCENIPEGHDPELWKQHNNCG